MPRRIEIKITGRVQGVFFRQAAKMVADTLGLTGWARNEPDGSVRIVAEGEEEKLQKLAEWCRTGTEYSKIKNVEIEWGETAGRFSLFDVG